MEASLHSQWGSYLISKHVVDHFLHKRSVAVPIHDADVEEPRDVKQKVVVDNFAKHRRRDVALGGLLVRRHAQTGEEAEPRESLEGRLAVWSVLRRRGRCTVVRPRDRAEDACEASLEGTVEYCLAPESAPAEHNEQIHT